MLCVVVDLIAVLFAHQLLNDSEATVMRLTEQAKILKEEIRRMERNQAREKEISNLEYLKNITYKVGSHTLSGLHSNAFKMYIYWEMEIV